MPKARRAGDRARVPPEAVLRQARVSLIRRATLLVDGRPEDVLVIDLGLSGAFVERASELPVDAAVALRFTLPGNELPLQALGRVAWWHAAGQPLVSKHLPAGLGLEFVEMSDADRRRVREYLLEQFRRSPRGRQFSRAWPTGGDRGGEPGA